MHRCQRVEDARHILARRRAVPLDHRHQAARIVLTRPDIEAVINQRVERTEGKFGVRSSRFEVGVGLVHRTSNLEPRTSPAACCLLHLVPSRRRERSDAGTQRPLKQTAPVPTEGRAPDAVPILPRYHPRCRLPITCDHFTAEGRATWQPPTGDDALPPLAGTGPYRASSPSAPGLLSAGRAPIPAFHLPPDRWRGYPPTVPTQRGLRRFIWPLPHICVKTVTKSYHWLVIAVNRSRAIPYGCLVHNQATSCGRDRCTS
jgi:hypothetical protein